MNPCLHLSSLNICPNFSIKRVVLWMYPHISCEISAVTGSSCLKVFTSIVYSQDVCAIFHELLFYRSSLQVVDTSVYRALRRQTCHWKILDLSGNLECHCTLFRNQIREFHRLHRDVFQTSLSNYTKVPLQLLSLTIIWTPLPTGGYTFLSFSTLTVRRVVDN